MTLGSSSATGNQLGVRGVRCSRMMVAHTGPLRAPKLHWQYNIMQHVTQSCFVVFPSAGTDEYEHGHYMLRHLSDVSHPEMNTT